MNDKKISLICTVKNEEETIGKFLDSLFYQTRMPDEIIIVDGGSMDRTAEIITSYTKKNGIIKIINQPGVNIAEGRNIAIRNAKNGIIAVTDAGCQLDIDWLNRIVKPFEEDHTIDVVSGWYEADARNDFEKCVAELTFPRLDNVLKHNDKFLPSSRSVAYKKECWEMVGGYPEWLYTAEDTLFDLKLKKYNCKFIFVKEAIVRWQVRPTMRKLFRQYYMYAKGDRQANLFLRPYMIYFSIYAVGLTLLVAGFLLPNLWAFLFLCVIAYLLIPTIKVLWRTKILKSIFITPIIVVLIDIAKIWGYTASRGLKNKNI